MKRISRLSVGATLLAASILAPLGILAMAGHAQEHNGKEKVPTAKEKFKNIKVLKDLPADQLIPVMRKINIALGVKCDACHIINPDHSGFEKDDKPMKDAARAMVRMVMDINKKQKAVAGKVTCYMCHHGHAEPMREPENTEEHGK